MPKESTDGNPRFDTDSTSVLALYYVKDVAVTTKSVTLTGALMGTTSAALALVAGVVAVSF